MDTMVTPASDQADLLTVAETARMLRVSERTVRRLARSGDLPGVRVGKQWRIDRDQLVTTTRRSRSA